jgi:hypothetical protein
MFPVHTSADHLRKIEEDSVNQSESTSPPVKAEAMDLETAPGDNQTSTSAGKTPSDTSSSSLSLITLTELAPNHGPLGGGEQILAVGSGFRAEQTLLIRFGRNNTLTATTFKAPNIINCLLPPYHTAGPVIVTLHWPDKPDSALKENQCLFTYEDLSARDV